MIKRLLTSTIRRTHYHSQFSQQPRLQYFINRRMGSRINVKNLIQSIENKDTQDQYINDPNPHNEQKKRSRINRNQTQSLKTKTPRDSHKGNQEADSSQERHSQGVILNKKVKSIQRIQTLEFLFSEVRNKINPSVNLLIVYLDRALYLESTNSGNLFDKPIKHFTEDLFELVEGIERKEHQILPRFYPSLFKSINVLETKVYIECSSLKKRVISTVSLFDCCDFYLFELNFCLF